MDSGSGPPSEEVRVKENKDLSFGNVVNSKPESAAKIRELMEAASLVIAREAGQSSLSNTRTDQKNGCERNVAPGRGKRSSPSFNEPNMSAAQGSSNSSHQFDGYQSNSSSSSKHRQKSRGSFNQKTVDKREGNRTNKGRGYGSRGPPLNMKQNKGDKGDKGLNQGKFRNQPKAQEADSDELFGDSSSDENELAKNQRPEAERHSETQMLQKGVDVGETARSMSAAQSESDESVGVKSSLESLVLNESNEDKAEPKYTGSLLLKLNQYREDLRNEIIAKQVETPQARLQKQLQLLSKHKQSLPIYSFKEELIKSVKNNQVVIVIGETGSGKSTQIPQYLVEAGFAKNGIIGITQPRRIAASSLAKRVTEELREHDPKVKLGGLVGYAVRFEKKTSKDTVIKYMTDGLLVKDCTYAPEPTFTDYSVVILDECHERSMHTDVCLGLLKRAAKERPELKIIVSSATLEHEKILQFFDNKAKVLNIEGRCYDVEVVYELQPEGILDYKQHAVKTVIKINEKEPEGDVLVFLPGKEEIDFVKSELTKVVPELFVVPCHASLPSEDQEKIFGKSPEGQRKIVLATNIAETSVTIDGIVYVVDSGFFKQNEYNPYTGIYSLVEQRITKFHAIQRKGRAGRTRPGKCYRLYPEALYNKLKDAPEPDIKLSNLSSVMLDLLAMGISNPLEFEFMDMPEIPLVMEAFEHLIELSALSDEAKLSELGKRMSSFPVDPPLAKVLIESASLGCSAEVLTIVAMLSSPYQNLFSRADRKRSSVDNRHEFFHADGDHLTLLQIYNQWNAVPMKGRDTWCRKNGIERRHLEEAALIRKQLGGILKRYLEIEVNLSSRSNEIDPEKSSNIRKAFVAGYFRQIAQKVGKNDRYMPLTAKMFFTGIGAEHEQYVYLHPSSSLVGSNPKPNWVIFHEVVKNKGKKAYMKGVSVIEPRWFKKFGGKFFEKYEKSRNRAGGEGGE